MKLYTLESVNLICGDHNAGESQPGAATYLALRQIKLPNIEENYVEHVPGGGTAAFEIYTHINRFESTFTLAGWQPRVQALLGRSSSTREAMRFTAYGVVRDQRSGKPMRAVAILWGRLGQVNPTAFRRGDLMEHEFAIKGIQRYALSMQEGDSGYSLLFYWDFFENRLVVDGNDVFNMENRIMGIPTEYTNQIPEEAYGY